MENEYYVRVEDLEVGKRYIIPKVSGRTMEGEFVILKDTIFKVLKVETDIYDKHKNFRRLTLETSDGTIINVQLISAYTKTELV
tara:strand:+ start:31 stop:282 length:252 start_codon:yes stop_codon:yes gene_type:complete